MNARPEAEVRAETHQERIARLEAEIAKTRAEWTALKQRSGGALRTLVDECLPSTAGVVGRYDELAVGMSVSVGLHRPTREALVEDIFNMLADNSGRFIRAMNPLS